MKTTLTICAALLLLLLAACSNIQGASNEPLAGVETSSSYWFLPNSNSSQGPEFDGTPSTLAPVSTFQETVVTDTALRYQRQISLYYNRTDANSSLWQDNVPWPSPGRVRNGSLTFQVSNVTFNYTARPDMGDVRVIEVRSTGNSTLAYELVWDGSANTTANITINVSSGVTNRFNEDPYYVLEWGNASKTLGNSSNINDNTSLPRPLSYNATVGSISNLSVQTQVTQYSGTQINQSILTSPIDVSAYTEITLWQNCSGSANVTSLAYQVSPDNRLWVPGAVAMTPCFQNGTHIDLTDKAVRFLRVNGSIWNLNETGGLLLMVSAK